MVRSLFLFMMKASLAGCADGVLVRKDVQAFGVQAGMSEKAIRTKCVR